MEFTASWQDSAGQPNRGRGLACVVLAGTAEGAAARLLQVTELSLAFHDTAERAGPSPGGQIPLTRNEIARLFAALILPPLRDLWHSLHWSTWRRRHQHRAQTCHYQRQAREP
jgi:hypothetical protein